MTGLALLKNTWQIHSNMGFFTFIKNSALKLSLFVIISFTCLLSACTSLAACNKQENNPAPIPPAALTFQTIFSDSFNIATWSTNWSSNHGEPLITLPTIINSPNPAGGKAMSALSSTSQPNPYRTELSLAPENLKLQDDKEYRISFETYVKQYDFLNPPNWMVISQFHATPGLDANGQIAWSCSGGRNPVSLTLAKGKYGVNINTVPAMQAPNGALADNDSWNEPITLNTWVKWVIRLTPSQTNKGVVQVWKDGILIATHLGRNKDTNDKCGHPDSPIVFFKIGTYKEYTNTGTQEIIYDNVKLEVLK